MDVHKMMAVEAALLLHWQRGWSSWQQRCVLDGRGN